MKPAWTAALLLCLLVAAARADRIIYRDFKSKSGTVKSFDEDGVRMGGDVLRWSEIERGSVAATKQEAFDAMLARLGDPLFRIRQRLGTGDYAGLLEDAETVYSIYESRNSETAHMVLQSVMWGRLAAGRREEAVAPYLLVYRYLRNNKTLTGNLPGDREPVFERVTGVTTELPPVWFDAAAAKRALPDVRAVVDKYPWPLDGANLLVGSLAAAAGEYEVARGYFDKIAGARPLSAEHKQIALAGLEIAAGKPGEAVAELERIAGALPAQTRPFALYWLGRHKTESEDGAVRQAGVLELLRLPAVYGKTQPELAGAAIHRSMATLSDLGDLTGNIALRRELLDYYPRSTHAKRLRSGGTK